MCFVIVVCVVYTVSLASTMTTATTKNVLVRLHGSVGFSVGLRQRVCMCVFDSLVHNLCG